MKKKIKLDANLVKNDLARSDFKKKPEVIFLEKYIKNSRKFDHVRL